MKKLLTILSTFSLFSFSTMSVVACGTKNDYDTVFDDNQNGNDGEYINSTTTSAITNIEKLAKKPLIVDVSLPNSSTNLDAKIQRMENERQIVFAQIIETISTALNLPNDRFAIEIADNNTFELPQLKGIELNEQGEKIVTEASVINGNARVTLKYLDNEICEVDFLWLIPEFQLVSEVANILNSNSYKNVGDYKQSKIDIPLGSVDIMGMSMKLTLGTITSFVGMLDLMYGMLGDAGFAIIDLKSMDISVLANADPSTSAGAKIYEKFDTDFRKNLRRIFSGIEDLLVSMGVPTTIVLPTPNEEDEDLEVKISELLDVNIFDLLDIDLSNISTSVSESSADIYVDFYFSSKGRQNYLSIIDLLGNIAPNFVKLLDKFLDPNTYDVSKGGTKNLVFVVLKELITNMHPDLEKINSINNGGNRTANAASSGLDSLLLNLLLGYDKTKRDEENAAIYIKLNIDVVVTVLGISYKVHLIDDELFNLLNKVSINPGDIALKIINRLFDFGSDENGKPIEFLTLDKPFLSPELNIQFITSNDVYYSTILDEAKKHNSGDENNHNDDTLLEDGMVDSMVKTILQAVEGTITDLIVNSVNDQINAALPTISLQDIINLSPYALLEELGLDTNAYDAADVTIVSANFAFYFYNRENNGQNWDKVSKGISKYTFEKYTSLKVKLVDVQFKVDYQSEKNGDYSFLTSNDITFDIIFSSDDKFN